MRGWAAPPHPRIYRVPPPRGGRCQQSRDFNELFALACCTWLPGLSLKKFNGAVKNSASTTHHFFSGEPKVHHPSPYRSIPHSTNLRRPTSTSRNPLYSTTLPLLKALQATRRHSSEGPDGAVPVPFEFNVHVVYTAFSITSVSI